MKKKYIRQSGLAGIMVLSLAMTGCGIRDTDKRPTADQVSTQTVTQTTPSPEKKEEKENSKFSLKATFDDGNLTIDKDGLSIKDKTGHVSFQDGKIDIQDEDGNVQLNNDGLVIKDDSTGKGSVKINKDGLYVEDEDCSVSWDKDGFKVKSDDGDLHFNFSFSGKSKSDDTSAKSKSVTIDSDWSRFFHSKEWEKFSDHMSDFLNHTLPDVIDNSINFCKNADWKNWDGITIINSDQVIDGKTTHVKIWFEDGDLKTMNVPEKNLTLTGYSLVETKEVSGDTIRTYRAK